MKYKDPRGWLELKKEILSRWHEITENDILKVRNERQSIIELLEKNVGLKIDEAARYFEEMASRFHLYEEPKDEKQPMDKDKKESPRELTPKIPADRDLKPKDDFHSA